MTCEHCGVRLDAGALVCPDCGREQRGGAALSPVVPDEAPVAHAQPCAKHPDLPVAGTCPRCGAFVCIRCAPGAASSVLTCADCLSREQQRFALTPSPFGGPLVLPLVGLVLKSFVFIAVVIAGVGLISRAGLLPRHVLIVLSGFSLVLTVPAFAGFLKRSLWAPRLLVGMYVLDAVIAGIGWRPSSVAWIAWSVAWSAYFLTSSRVKQTFTER